MFSHLHFLDLALLALERLPRLLQRRQLPRPLLLQRRARRLRLAGLGGGGRIVQLEELELFLEAVDLFWAGIFGSFFFFFLRVLFLF